MRNWIRHKLINFVVRELFNGVTENDILRVHGIHVIIGDKEVSKEHTMKIIADATMLSSNIAWQALLFDMKYVANKLMFEKSVSEKDMQFGKAVLYIIELLNKKILSYRKLPKANT